MGDKFKIPVPVLHAMAWVSQFVAVFMFCALVIHAFKVLSLGYVDSEAGWKLLAYLFIIITSIQVYFNSEMWLDEEREYDDRIKYPYLFIKNYMISMGLFDEELVGIYWYKEGKIVISLSYESFIRHISSIKDENLAIFYQQGEEEHRNYFVFYYSYKYMIIEFITPEYFDKTIQDVLYKIPSWHTVVESEGEEGED